MEVLRFPRELKLGVSSCALQTEGGNVKNSWYGWYKKGHIKDGSSPERACGFYENYRRDIDIAAQMGIKYMRLGIEWSRIEPAKGVFNNGVLMYYRSMIGYALANGIVPMLTLHSFSDPVWFDDLGGFESDGCSEIYLHYVKKAAETFGDLVNSFITFDEPNLYALNGYFYGTYPPGKQSYKLYRKVLTNLAVCHAAAYGAIHETRRAMGYEDTRVSCTLYAEQYVPEDEKSFYQRRAAEKLYAFNWTAFAKAVLTGECIRPMNKLKDLSGCHADFIALDYLTGSEVTGLEKRELPDSVPVSSNGRLIRPDGIAECAKKLYDMKELPVYVTACGVCDKNDTFRIRFLYEHLRALAGSGLPVEYFYYRSFTDCFEFLEGEESRYGLVAVDFETGERKIKQSGHFYAEAASRGGITEDMCLKYRGQYYRSVNGTPLAGIDSVYYDREKFLKSDNGQNVITDVENYVKDPSSYSEEETREANGLTVQSTFPAEGPAEEALREEPVLTPVEALDRILGR